MQKRIVLSEENSIKAEEAERQLREKYGIQVSPNQIVNIFFAAIQSAELHQLVQLTIRYGSPAAIPQAETKKKVSKTAQNWILSWK
jgi:hypothetical protein